MTIFGFVKEKIRLIDVVRQQITLHKSGANFKARCPFHNEKTASFLVDPDKELYYCFGCHAGGDLITFISRIENCSSEEAAELLIERFQLTVPEQLQPSTQDKQGHKTSDRQRHFDTCNIIQRWCHENLERSSDRQASDVKKYLNNRGFNDAIIKQFCLGYFPSGSYQQLLKAARGKNILLADLIKAQFVLKGSRNYFCPFEGRIIFPLADHLGRVIAFGGRTYAQHDERPKYYNSKEHHYFQKRSTLFGLDKAKKAIQASSHAFIVEGYTDLLALVQHGYTDTVATLGTSVTSEHLALINRYATRLTCLFDGDEAGRRAIVKLHQLCWSQDIELAIIQLPPGEDPASYLQKKQLLTPLIATAEDSALFLLHQLWENIQTKSLQEKLAAVKDLLAYTGAQNDPLKQHVFLQRISESLAIPYDTLWQALKSSIRALGQQIKSDSKVLRTLNGSISPITVLDKWAALSHLEKKLFAALTCKKLDSQKRRQILDALPEFLQSIAQQLHLGTSTFSPQQLIQALGDLPENNKQLVSRLLIEDHRVAARKEIEQIEAIDELLAQVKKQQWKSYVTTKRQEISQAQKAGNAERVTQLLNELNIMKNKLVKSKSPF